MDPTTLRNLNRPALQKLAKEHKIKANLKSEAIIELLLQRQAQKSSSRRSARLSSLSTSKARLSEIQHGLRQSNSPRNPIVDVRQGSDREAPDDLPRESNADPLIVSEKDYSVDLEGHEAMYQESTYTFGTPVSSPAASPEPEAPSDDLRKTVEFMAKINEDDQEISKAILECRRIAAKARNQAEALKKRATAARAIRLRLEKYSSYWRWFSPHWTYEEVWKGPMRIVRKGTAVVEITSSDDERLDELVNPSAVDESLTTTLPSRRDDTNVDEPVERVLPPAPQITPPASPPEVSSQYPIDLRGALTRQQASTSSRQNGKRRREDPEDNEEENRYRPYRRSPPLSSGRPVSAGTPSRKHLGKGKMSLSQVEDMLDVNGGEWDMQVMAGSEVELDSNDHLANLSISEEEVEYDIAVSQQLERVRREEFLRLPLPGAPPTWHLVESSSIMARPSSPSPLRAV